VAVKRQIWTNSLAAYGTGVGGGHIKLLEKLWDWAKNGK